MDVIFAVASAVAVLDGVGSGWTWQVGRAEAPVRRGAPWYIYPPLPRSPQPVEPL